MPKKEQTLQAFLDDSTLLIQASPTTVSYLLYVLIQTRLTLKYRLPKPTETNATATAILVAKAYDPIGGVCLKYETNRAVEVGRLVLGFQELGQHMQNVTPTVKRKSSGGEEEVRGEPTLAVEEPIKIKQEEKEIKQEPQATSQSGAEKKKKKGKR
jgi:hypothetical protein